MSDGSGTSIDERLSEVLAAAAEELRQAYDRGLRLESAILQMMARNPDRNGADLAELQHLDLVLQHVSAIAGLLGRIAHHGGDVAALERAIDQIVLSDVQARLRGGANPAEESDGDEMFFSDSDWRVAKSGT